jgi:hypothetical protein
MRYIKLTKANLEKLAALLSSIVSVGMGFLFLGVGMALKQIDVWTRGAE